MRQGAPQGAPYYQTVVVSQFEKNIKITICEGASRLVIICYKWAIKVPNPRSYISFLAGLRANWIEVRNYKFAKEGVFPIKKFCPILFNLPLGALIVMKKAKILTDQEFDLFDCKNFCDLDGYLLPVEHKPDSFGFLGEQIVAVDFG